MQDRKALQAGTSHFLGQNFSKASQIQYQSREGRNEYAWTTSWGVSTRLIGGMIMTHADDDGMIMPPRLAPQHVVLLPLIKKEEEREAIMAYTDQVAASLRALRYHEREIEVRIDTRDLSPGEKGWSWVKKGIPVRVEIGMRELENDALFVAWRDTTAKAAHSRSEFIAGFVERLDQMQQTLLTRAQDFRDAHSVEIDEYSEFERFFTPKNKKQPEAHGGFAYSHWCGGAACEEKINKALAVTIRLIPFNREPVSGATCIVCSKQSAGRVVFAKSY